MNAPLLRVAFATSLSTRCTAPGVRPGGRVTFLCRAREKSPKERRLTACRRHAAKARARERSLVDLCEATRFALAAVPVATTTHRTFTPVNAACTAGSPLKAPLALTRRPSGACIATREFGVQPTLGARTVEASRSSQGQPRERSGSPRATGQMAVLARGSRRQRSGVRLSASLLVTFLWRDREKLPALAGRIPAAVHRAAKAPCKSNPSHGHEA